MSDRPWHEEPEGERFLKRALHDMAPKMAESIVVTSLVPKNDYGDPKFWVETGAAICMNKPIILLAEVGQEIPAKLVKVADKILRYQGDLNSIADELAALIRDMADEMGAGTQ